MCVALSALKLSKYLSMLPPQASDLGLFAAVCLRSLQKPKGKALEFSFCVSGRGGSRAPNHY
jgi:hypothetical protein